MSLLFVGPVIALAWVAFREDAWFRRLFGLGAFAPRETVTTGTTGVEGVALGLAARLGHRAEPTVTLDRSVHRATWGVRALTLAITAMLYGVAPRVMAEELLWHLHSAPVFWAVLSFVAYSNLYVWAYRLEIDRETLSVMGSAFLMRDYPLAALERVEEDGPYAWRMRFADGRRAHVMKAVVGSAGLRQRLADVLKVNGH